MGRLVALLVGFGLVATACGSSQDVVRIESTPTPTTLLATAHEAPAPSVAAVETPATTLAPPSTSTPTTSPSAPATTERHAEIIMLLDRIGTADPFGPLQESFHFVARLQLLDVSAPAPSTRAGADFVTVLSGVGDASPSAASFTVSDPETTVSGRIIDTTIWLQRGDEWKQNEITDPIAEVVAVSYRNWTVFLVQMISLTTRFADDTEMVSEPWGTGEHVTITATGTDTTDPLVAAGMPIATELWVDEHGVLRSAEVQGFVLWSGTFVPAGLTMQIDRVPEPVIVAPTNELTEPDGG